MSNPYILEEGLLLFLRSSVGITSLTTTAGIYMNSVPETAHEPCMFFSKISAQPDTTFDGPSGLNYRRYQFETLSKSFVSAVRLQAAIRIALDGYSGTLPNGQRVYNIIRDNELDGFDDVTGEHRTITDYFIHFAE